MRAMAGGKSKAAIAERISISVAVMRSVEHEQSARTVPIRFGPGEGGRDSGLPMEAVA
jgi:hypothetical protein